MFDSLQQMAKMDREGAPGEDNKGQLNYYVIIIGEFSVLFYESVDCKAYLLVLYRKYASYRYSRYKTERTSFRQFRFSSS